VCVFLEKAMTGNLGPGDLQALALLSKRNYGEEGIPMMLVLENESSVVAGVDPSASCLGPLLREAAEGSAIHTREHGTVDLALLIEWIADRTFGPAALAQTGDEACDA
jgi:hypothetical protein